MMPISNKILQKAKWSFTTRRVDRSSPMEIKYGFDGVAVGDLIIAQVVEIGSHKRVHLPSGRPSHLYVDDYVVMALGNRYAPDQFEAKAALRFPCSDLVAAGGVIGTVINAHDRMKEPTSLRPIGVVVNKKGEHVNLNHYALSATSSPDLDFVVVTGAQMNSGKTTAAAKLIQGLHRQGLNVAAIKATGTGAFGDLNSFSDAGAEVVLDFTDMGMPTTYLESNTRITESLMSLLSCAKERGADVAVVELGDGVFQQESFELLQSDYMITHAHSVLFAAPDSLSATHGVNLLSKMGYNNITVGGLITCSPLAVREFTARNNNQVAGTASLIENPFTVYASPKYC